MPTTKPIKRVKLPVVAKTRLELVKKMLDLQITLDKPFLYDVETLTDSKGKIVEVVGWYYDTLKEGDRRLIE